MKIYKKLPYSTAKDIKRASRYAKLGYIVIAVGIDWILLEKQV